MKLPTIDFRFIRDHRGTQSGGFEELAYQLIPWIDEEVAEHEVVRHGTPDGGVEAHVDREDGVVWGWQAKYFDKVGDSQLRQMKKSLESALKSYPNLARYTFVIPFNPPSGRRKGTKSAKQKLDEAFARWESEAAADGQVVDIRLVAESQLLDVLKDEEHTGRVLYWFGKRILLSKTWLEDKLAAAIESAGTRYTPEINVELPVGFAFEGLGRTEAFEGQLLERARQVGEAARRLRPAKRGSALVEDLRLEADRLADETESVLVNLSEVSVVGTDPLNWKTDIEAIAKTQGALDGLAYRLLPHVRALREQEGEGVPQHERASELVERVRLGARQVEGALSELNDYLRGPAARLSGTPLLFFEGEAGTGKTHLLCDIAEHRLAEGRPTVLVMGQQIGEGDPRTLLLAQLDLHDLTMEQFLSALNVAGEAAGTRALLMVDAINEGGAIRTWPPYLRTLAADVAGYSHLGLVVSCRSSYIQAILPDEPGVSDPEHLGFVAVRHAGFAGHEWEAVRTFFGNWNLALPDFPLLAPEYTNPLFLKLLCKSLSDAGVTSLPRGATGVTSLFGLFLREANSRLCRPGRCDYRMEDDLVSQTVAKVAERMLASGEDWLPFSEFERICKEILPDRGWSNSLTKALLDEGVVARDALGRDEIVRLSYQRLGDHLQAEELLRTGNEEPLQAFLDEVEATPAGFYRRSGLLEALAVQLPEKVGSELHELLTEPGHQVVQKAFLKSIIWRNPESFPDDDALDYLNSIIKSRHSWYDDPVLDTLLQVACVPDHPFNAERLDQSLARMPLADRDAWWTTYINSCSREDSVIYRIIDWARSPEQQAVADDAARLAAITLTWFLTSSNRQLRDCATKALVSLLYRRIPVLVDLLSHFDSVDDPYIAERLYAAAYGCALSTTDPEALKTLASAVYEKVFASRHPPVDIMLRDYARGVIEVAAERNLAPSHVSLSLVRPPYQSPWPMRVPTQDQLDRRAPLETHRELHASLTSVLGDFARYTVGHAVRQFEAPNQRQRRRLKRDEALKDCEEAWAELLESLDARQEALLAQVGSGSEAGVAFTDSLHLEQRALLSRVLRAQSPTDPAVMWTDAEAARWIFRRVLELGWAPERLGTYDRMVRSQGRGADDDRTERIGKKYQWIALHELLARIADHCRFAPRFSDEVDSYDGPSQLSLRDVDPSVALSPCGESNRQGPVTWWQPLAVEVGPFVDDKSRIDWLTTDLNIPTAGDLGNLIQAHQPDGSAWLTLHGMYSWKEDPLAYASGASARKALLWLQVRSYLIPRRDLPAFMRWAEKQDWCGRWMPEGPSTYDTYLGEWPWRKVAGPDSDGRRTVEGRHYQKGEAPTELIPTWADYHWEGDGSLAGGVNGVIPASWVISCAGLRWHAGDFAFTDSNGEVVVIDPSSREQGPSALLVREDFLRSFLDREGYSLVWTALGEKDAYGELDRLHPPFLGISGVGGLESGDGALDARVRTWLQTPGGEPTSTTGQE